MKQRIILLTPPFNILKEGKGSLFFSKGYGNHIPLGIAQLASVIEEGGHHVDIIDSAANASSIEDIISMLKKLSPDIIGISTTTASKKSTYELAKRIKQHLKIQIIVGGPHAMAFSDDILRECSFIDIVCHSEGEIVVIKLLEALRGNMPIENVDGISYRYRDRIIKNPKFSIVQDLDKIPFPAYHKFNIELYKALPKQVKRRPYLPYITSRGCYYGKCTFCFQAGRIGQKYRRLSPERVVKDIKYLIDRFKVKEITFWDDNFLIGNRWLIKFVELMKNNNINITWSCCGRVDTINEDMLTMLSKIGLWNIFFGFESCSQKLLDKIKKGITLEQSRKAAKICKKLGIDIRGSFMLALPGSNPQLDKQTVEFAKEIDIPYAQFHVTFPEYGTELYDIALKEGKISKDVEFEGRTTATYIPDGYKNAKEIEKISRWAYTKFYFRPKYIFNHIKNIHSFNDIKEYIFGALFVFGIILGKLIKKKKIIPLKVNSKGSSDLIVLP